MTTYPLSEPATIYADKAQGSVDAGVIGRGTLADCAEIVEALPPEVKNSARIEMDDLDIRFGPAEIEELLQFLRDEGEGLSDREIKAIVDPDH